MPKDFPGRPIFAGRLVVPVLRGDAVHNRIEQIYGTGEVSKIETHKWPFYFGLINSKAVSILAGKRVIRRAELAHHLQRSFVVLLPQEQRPGQRSRRRFRRDHRRDHLLPLRIG